MLPRLALSEEGRMRSSNLPAALLRPRRQQSAPIFKTAAVMLRAHVTKTTVDKAARELFGKDHGLDFRPGRRARWRPRPIRPGPESRDRRWSRRCCSRSPTCRRPLR